MHNDVNDTCVVVDKGPKHEVLKTAGGHSIGGERHSKTYYWASRGKSLDAGAHGAGGRRHRPLEILTSEASQGIA